MTSNTARTSTRIAGFGVGLVALFGAGAGIGAVAGPDVVIEEEAPPPMGDGVISVQDGYRFALLDDRLEPEGDTLRFSVLRQEGDAVVDFTEIHERDLHLIVVDRQLAEFHHVHPTLDDGVWSVDLPALPPGSYRAIADFQVEDGPRLALGADLSVAGAYEPEGTSEPTAETSVDGYDVSISTERDDAGEVIATLTVRRDGELVTDLEPYLGADGHLVALRSGDLAYAHVHPVEDDETTAGPGQVQFDATLASAGRYGLFFDFQHEGEVHTASFTFDQGPVTDEPEEH